MTPGTLYGLAACLMIMAASMLQLSLMRARTASRLDEARRAEARLMRTGHSLWRRQTQRRERAANLALRLRQAGYIGTRAQVSVLLSVALVVLGIAIAAALYGLRGGAELVSELTYAAMGLLVGTLLGWLWLKRRVAARKAQLDDEAELLIQVTRMLWETGMTLEGVLRGLILNLGEVLPATCLELRVALARIESGQERGEVLESLADLQPSEATEAYFNLLAQVSVAGGSARQSLKALSELLDDRRRTTLQEKVTKMSGKMSLIMMVFLFPVMLIVVAGPAMVNLGQMLNSLSGGN